jgi:transcriptional regulator with XRE-family HTH domain
MSTRQRPGDTGAADARRFVMESARELSATRRKLGISQSEAARRAGMSQSQLSRLERGELDAPTLDQLCRAIRAVGLVPAFQRYLGDVRVHDRAQLAVLSRFEGLVAPPVRIRREVPLPLSRDNRAWDARLTDGERRASVECVSRLDDTQALARQIALTSRDDPSAGPVLLVLNKTAHNRDVLRLHREAMRDQFPLDGGAIAAALRSGRVPAASGIILL